MDVGEEVVVGEVVVGDRIIRDEAASSRAERSPKTLSPFSRTGLKRCGFGGLLVGERSINSKFSYVSPRSIYGETSNEGRRVHLHTLVDR